MAKARKLKQLRPDDPYRRAAQAVVAVRAKEVFKRADGVLDTTDVERVHAMRVATRRLRAALEAFAPCFPKKPYRRILQDVKKLADALGERRDCDVQLASLEGLEDLADREALAAQTLTARLRDEQLAANVVLSKALDRAKRGHLRRRLKRLVS